MLQNDSDCLYFTLMKKLFIILFPAILGVGCGHIPRTLWYNFPSVKDNRIFKEAKIQPSGDPVPYILNNQGLPPTREWVWSKDTILPRYAEDFLRKSGTDAFVVLRQDTVIFEYYDKKMGPKEALSSNSVAKAIISTLTGIAWKQGFIRSIDQPVLSYLPELKGKISSQLKIRDLLQMTAGLNFSESYLNPFSTIAHLYYTRHSERMMRKIHQREMPGTEFEYLSANYWLLTRIIEKATRQPIDQFTQKELWEPLGMPDGASWSLDRENGLAKGFTGFNTTARALARIGQLYLLGGNWEGTQILPTAWVETVQQQDTTRGASSFYKLGWFPSSSGDYYYAAGMFYQFLFIHPASNTVIVRLGDDPDTKTDWIATFRALSGQRPKPQPLPLAPGQEFLFNGDFRFGTSNLGDSTLNGRIITVAAQKKKESLKIWIKKDPKSVRKLGNQVPKMKKFYAWRKEEVEFYDPKTYRTLVFSTYGDSITWKREGISWQLDRIRRR